MSALADLFPDTDYRFHLTLRRGTPAEFFAGRDSSGAVTAERRRWLAADPRRYAALLPDGEPLLREFVGFSEEWTDACDGSYKSDTSDFAGLLAVGCALEPDLLFLSPDGAGDMRLRGGVLCFPTGWALEEKVGCTMDAIHGVVPGLNAALGPAIRQFLAKLKPGVAYLRDNWGLAATAELNLHPARAVAAPGLPVALDRLWLRVEHQALIALPRSGGVAFGIRIALHRLDDVVAAGVGPALRRALETMPADLAHYKRVHGIRGELARLL